MGLDLTTEILKTILEYCVEHKATLTFSAIESMPGDLKLTLKFYWPAHTQIYANTLVFDLYRLKDMNSEVAKDYIAKMLDDATREVYNSAR